ncbi:MAG: helix-turn-helix domain-containing protein [Candidatus Scalindua sp.]|nr:helix-turn-helix domain-containing protein [Candidatus Scalindua sp.]
MKIEIDNAQLVNDIVEKVVERLKPLISNSHDSRGDELMDVKALADYLKVKKQWVYDKTHMNIIPYYKVGKYPRYKKSKIDEWLLEKENRNNARRVI